MQCTVYLNFCVYLCEIYRNTRIYSFNITYFNITIFQITYFNITISTLKIESLLTAFADDLKLIGEPGNLFQRDLLTIEQWLSENLIVINNKKN